MISVGIPAYNEEKSVSKTIASVLKQIGKDDEVLVVDNGSKDNTSAEIKKMNKKDKRVKLLVIKDNNGKVPALNLIIKSAKSDIIVQTDADVKVEDGAIQKLLPHFKDPKIGGVSGNPIPIIPKDNIFYDWTIMSYRKAGEVRKQESDAGIFWHMSGYLLAFRKKALKEVPFAKGAVDAWMGKVIKDNGYKMVYEPEARVLVKAPLNTKDFIKQKARVRAGYYILIKQTGKAPRTVQREIFWLPKELFRVPLWRWHKFIYSGFVYLYTWFKGRYLAMGNKSVHQIWQTPTSTK
jgi:cellulose synthase/poly-beta-1,6-N-acetylglucosamine synthase-like glycosyltransferase